MKHIDRCFQGDVRTILPWLIEEGVKVQTVVTSPPYYALRDYGVRGQLGLEPTLPEYLHSMVEVFRHVRELLRDDGTCWLNMGDSWAGSPGGWQGAPQAGTGHRASRTHAARIGVNKGVAGGGFKHKDLMMVPARLAIALQDDGWYLRQQIIWEKPNCMPESQRDRFTNAHEYVYLLAKSRRYLFDQSALMEDASPDTHARYARGRSADHKNANNPNAIARGFEHMLAPELENPAQAKLYQPVSGWAAKGEDHSAKAHATPDANGRRRKGAKEAPARDTGAKNNASFAAATGAVVMKRKMRSVWSIPSQGYSEAHFATFPEALVARCVAAGSRTGDLVLDPFMGSGTTAQVAQRMGRHWLGCELSPDYLAIQKRRAAQTGLELRA